MGPALAIASRSSDSTSWENMIDYTARLTALMGDIVSRVPTLSFIDMNALLVFGRFGRSGHAGPVATCHCLSLPPSDPGYYFWRDRATGQVTRRSEWFVTRSPEVAIGTRQVNYLISFTLPRFCDQGLDGSRKERFYPRSTQAWVAKLDTVIHELYHIDPDYAGIRRPDRAAGRCSSGTHTPEFFAQVARMVIEYLDAAISPAIYDFLIDDFATLSAKHDGVVGTCFRPFPSYPQRFRERLESQPVSNDPRMASVNVEPWRAVTRRTHFTEEQLHARQFFAQTSRQRHRTRSSRAA